MNKNMIAEIVKKYLSGRFAADTEEAVQRWIIKDKNAEEKAQASLAYWNSLESDPDDISSAYKRVKNKIDSRSVPKISLRRRFTRIAAILFPLFLLAGGYFYYHMSRDHMTVIAVAYGEKKYLMLPDGSELWINAGSTVTYPVEFKDNDRVVYLDGEAYFSVEKDEAKPFIVKTKALSVKVLGTRFNVKAYADDEKVSATLTSGKVEVTTEAKVSNILKPNEQLIFNKTTSAIEITEITPTDGWLNGQLNFNNVSLKEIIQTLERRFDVTIENRTDIPESKQYTVRFLKDETPDEIMTVLGELIGFSYEKSNDKQFLIRNK